jgi:glycosyltransferase involved in cell wall biosynthesis
MKILLVAAVPFFRERGTPIAVRLLCETLCEAGHSVDLLTYHLGEDISVPGLTIRRIPRIPLIRDVPIGFSWRKVLCDIVLSVQLALLVARNEYQVIHAVEEAVFPALLIKALRRRMVIYDMDSSLPDQLVENRPYLRRIAPLLYRFERFAVRGADHVITACDELAVRAREYDAGKPVTVLRDVPLKYDDVSGPVENLRETCGIRGLLALYVGNLERYQGIDLMLEGFALARPAEPLELIVVGGGEADIARYQRKAQLLGIGTRVHFIGTRPITHLQFYLEQASILISPRLTGNNTPMKVYSYLAAGKPVLATGISSHTQVMDDSCALLVEPQAQDFARGIETLAADETLRRRLGQAARERADSRHTLREYKRTVMAGYDRLATGADSRRP